jgi:hypothetical protein
MKKLLLVIFIIYSYSCLAVCTSTISRTNSGAGQVLSSTKYNLDLNTIYTRINELPGDCITNGTITYTKLDTSSLAPLVKGIKEGCLATRSDANTISVDKCLIAVNGTLIEKTTATTVTWGCSGCSSEVASTTYYVYATSASSLTLQILTTAPDAYGYNGTSRVLALFYNDASSNIDSQSVRNWIINGFFPLSSTIVSSPGSKPLIRYAQYGGSGSLTSQTNCTSTPCTEYVDDSGMLSMTRSGTGTYLLTGAAGMCKPSGRLHISVEAVNGANNVDVTQDGSSRVTDSSGGFAMGFVVFINGGAATDSRTSVMVSCEAP